MTTSDSIWPAGETIVAVSTPYGRGGIGIVRWSGDLALPIARRLFRLKRGKEKIEARRAVAGTLIDPETASPIDEGVLVFFRAPRSYTGEDLVEISLHGNPVILEEAVRLGVRLGARPAHPGEFTLRAFLNGRMDLLQAEAVDDLIRAASLTEARLAFRTMVGGLSERIRNIRESIIEILARLETAVEFPDDDIIFPPGEAEAMMSRTTAALEDLVRSHDLGKTLFQGTTLAIVGRANTGKSTLFNSLLGESRAIVSRHPGTTRDYLREKVVIAGTAFNLVDSAGWGGASSPVEKEGIRKGREVASRADGLLVVLDVSRKPSPEDEELLDASADRKAILVFNKIDRPAKMVTSEVRKAHPKAAWVEISARNGMGLSDLKEMMGKIFAPSAPEADILVLRLRDKTLLEEIRDGLAEAVRLRSDGAPEEIQAEEIRLVLPAIGRLIGEIRTDEILEQVFGRFCVGK